ncbi:hypothetical protein BJY00DRAFT_295920 [Aspergillus carlsbadensis]|nr:hypothetical protein BJY00DRAFT_295920 [Aspergillus carlsbadensis]
MSVSMTRTAIWSGLPSPCASNLLYLSPSGTLAFFTIGATNMHGEKDRNASSTLLQPNKVSEHGSQMPLPSTPSSSQNDRVEMAYSPLAAHLQSSLRVFWILDRKEINTQDRPRVTLPLEYPRWCPTRPWLSSTPSRHRPLTTR